MTVSLDRMAYDAGFRKAGEVQACNQPKDEFMGMKFITDGRMPEGWIGIRNEKGVTMISARGAVVNVPFFDVAELFYVATRCKQS